MNRIKIDVVMPVLINGLVPVYSSVFFFSRIMRGSQAVLHASFCALPPSLLSLSRGKMPRTILLAHTGRVQCNSETNLLVQKQSEIHQCAFARKTTYRRALFSVACSSWNSQMTGKRNSLRVQVRSHLFEKKACLK